MRYAAFKSSRDGTDFSFEGRDDAIGILGTHKSHATPPIATADTLDELRCEVLAYLGKEPDDSLYLTDADGRVHEIIINEKHHQAVDHAYRRLSITIALVIFSCTCLLTAARLGGLAPLLFVGVAVVYAVVLRTRLFNPVEGAVCCELLLIVGMAFIAALRDRQELSLHGTGTEEIGKAVLEAAASKLEADFTDSRIVDRGEPAEKAPQEKQTGTEVRLPARDGTVVVLVADRQAEIRVFKSEGRIEVIPAGTNEPIVFTADPNGHALQVEKGTSTFSAARFDLWPETDHSILARFVETSASNDSDANDGS